MAQKVVLSDDLDGSNGPDVANVTYDVDGTAYEIDLSEKNHRDLNEALEAYENARAALTRFTDVSRTVKGPRASKAQRVTLAGGYTNADVRKWAKESEQVEINPRGKIPNGIYEAFYKAYPDAKPN